AAGRVECEQVRSADLIQAPRQRAPRGRFGSGAFFATQPVNLFESAVHFGFEGKRIEPTFVLEQTIFDFPADLCAVQHSRQRSPRSMVNLLEFSVLTFGTLKLQARMKIIEQLPVWSTHKFVN